MRLSGVVLLHRRGTLLVGPYTVGVNTAATGLVED